MSKPVGEPPSAAELEQKVKSYFASNAYGPFTCDRVDDSYLIFTSQSYPVQFELRIQGDFESIEYDVYETPATGESLYSGTKESDIPYNPAFAWDEHLSRLLMTISGSINGAIHRGELELREE